MTKSPMNRLKRDPFASVWETFQAVVAPPAARRRARLQKKHVGKSPAGPIKPVVSKVIPWQGAEDTLDGRIALWVPRRLYNEQSKGMRTRDGSTLPFKRWEKSFRDSTFVPLMESHLRGLRGDLVHEVWLVQVTPPHKRYRFDSDNGMRACKRTIRDPLAAFLGRDDADHMPGSISWKWGWAYGPGFGVLVLISGEALMVPTPVDGEFFVPRKCGTELAIRYKGAKTK